MNTDTTIQKLWEQYHPEFDRVLQSKGVCPTDAQDILQELFLKVIQHQKKIEAAQQPRAYLYAMLWNTKHDFFNKNSQDPAELPEQLAEENWDLSSNERFVQNCLLPLVNALDPIYQEALVKSDLEGYSQKELAQQLNLSYSGLKSRVQRARQQLKTYVMKYCAPQTDAYGNIITCCNQPY